MPPYFPPTLTERLHYHMQRSRCPIWPENWGKEFQDEYYRLLEAKDLAVCNYETGLENRRREKEGRAFAKERGVEYDSEEHTPSPQSSPQSSPAASVSVSPQVITPKKRATYALRPDLEPLKPMYLMPSHFEPEEASEFRLRFHGSGGRLGDVHKATTILTKVRSVRRTKLDLRDCGIWTEDTGTDGDGVLTVVNIDWINKSWEAEKLQSINDYVVYRGRKIAKPSVDNKQKRRLDEANGPGAKKHQQK